jgi:hypothetical protein
MRTIAVTLACLAASTLATHAHPGHLGRLDGHDHTLALAAGLAAASIVGALALRGIVRLHARRRARALAAHTGEAA